MEREEAIALVQGLRTEAGSIRLRQEPSRDRLVRRARMILSRLFGESSSYVNDLGQISFWSMTSDPRQQNKAWLEGKEAVINLLATAEEELTVFGYPTAGTAEAHAPVFSRKVFVVHGHDHALKDIVARLLGQLELEPIILHEHPNSGRTIIEKFEDYSDVAFAVVLLTPDDVGREKVKPPEEDRPRARQNVVLELGFFLGRLGRERVAALHRVESRFELPSDYSGVLFVPVDDGGNWRLKLVQELKAAGLEIDANKLFK